MARDRHPVELEPIEEPEQVALVVGVAVRVAVLAQAVTSKVECDYANAGEQGDNPQPVAEVTRQSVQEEDRWACSHIRIGEPRHYGNLTR